MKVVYDDMTANIANAEKLLNSIDEPFDIAVLPECFDLGWANPNAVVLANPEIVKNRLCSIAKKKNIYIVAGITERENSKLYNMAILINDSGVIIGKHSKIDILTDVEYMYSVGTSISVFDTIFGKIGIPICADCFIKSIVIPEAMARMGCDMILSPCAWAVDNDFIVNNYTYGETWTVPYKQLARIYKIPVIGVSYVGNVTRGAWDGQFCIGNSIAVNADCEVIALPFGADAECVRIIEFNLYERPPLGTELLRYIDNLK